MRSKWQARGRTLSAMAASVIFFFFLTEVSLRLFGKYSSPRAEREVNPNAFRIVMMGNSHTAGYEVPHGKQYSYVLENFFKKERPTFAVQVFNEGYPNGNTAILNGHLDRIIPSLKPHLVVLLSGEPNIWNAQGFTQFLESKNKTPSFEEKLKSFALQSRVIRWLYLLPHVAVKENKENMLELEAYKILARYEKLSLEQLPPQQIVHEIDVLEKFLEKHKKDPPVARPRFLNALAILKYKNKDDKGSLEVMEGIVRERPGVYDPDLREALDYFHPDQSLVPRTVALIEKNLAARPVKKELDILESARRPKFFHIEFSPQNEALLLKLQSQYPWLPPLSRFLAETYQDRWQFADALRILESHMRANPLQTHGLSPSLFISYAETPNFPAELKPVAARIRDEFLSRFPSEAHYVTILKDNERDQWISWGIGRSVDKIRDAGVKVVLLNYHPVSMVSFINPVIEKVAKEKKVPLVDIFSRFQKEVSAHKNPRQFYSDFHGPQDKHPSEEGHKLFARIIYDHLNEQKLLPEELLNLDAKKILKYSDD